MPYTPSQYNLTQIDDKQQVNYGQLQAELKRCGVKATGNYLDLKRRMQAHITNAPGEAVARATSTQSLVSPQMDTDTDISGGLLIPDSQLQPVTSARQMHAAASLGNLDQCTPNPLVGVTFSGDSGGFHGEAEDAHSCDEDDLDLSNDGAGDSDLEDSENEDASHDSNAVDTTSTQPARAATSTSASQKPPAAKKAEKAAHFSANEFVRMAHCVIAPENRTALGSLMAGRSRTQLDAGFDGWEEIAAMHNDTDTEFEHPQIDAGGEYCGSPRINVKFLDPNAEHETRTAAQMKKKWAELKKWLTVYFERWCASGQMTADVEEKSITDFLRPESSDKSTRHPKERVIKYVHLLFKGDEDLLTFASKAIGKHGRESGAKAVADERPGKRRQVDNRADMIAALSVETPSQKLMAAAWSTEAEAQLLSCVTSILAQLDKVPPGAIRTLLEARLTKLLEQDIGGAQALPATSTPGPARNLPDDGAAGGRS